MSGLNVFDPSVDPIKRILIVDDDPEMRGLIERKLTNAGFEVVQADSGVRALAIIDQIGLPHLAVVDINMPGMSGLELCESVQQFADLPVIMVTAVHETQTTIRAIELYAEDYIVKPFNLDELVVRVQRLLRRIGDFSYATGAVIEIDAHLAICFVRKQAIVEGQPVELTPIETKILHILWRNVNRAVTNEFLLGRIWPNQEVFEDTLRVHVHRLRHKIEGATSKKSQETGRQTRKYIITERGRGYRLVTTKEDGV